MDRRKVIMKAHLAHAKSAWAYHLVEVIQAFTRFAMVVIPAMPAASGSPAASVSPAAACCQHSEPSFTHDYAQCN
jgi:hypothetical protein